MVGEEAEMGERALYVGLCVWGGNGAGRESSALGDISAS